MTLSQLKTEIFSGLTISTALVPEAISFALLVGVSPSAGLWAAFFMAISTSLLGGQPAIISGATGATAVILASFVSINGEENAYLAVILAGLIQLIIFISRLWKIFNLIPQIVISGFLISLAILILISQIKYFQISNLTINKQLLMGGVAIISALSMFKLSTKIKIPPALIAIIIGSIGGVIFTLPTIGDLSTISSNLPKLTIPIISIDSILLVLPYSIGIAISGLTESLIAVDHVCSKIGNHSTISPKAKETFSQGVGNIISGLFSSIGGCVLIGQTNLNISAGSKTRISSLSASIGLFFIIILFSTLIQDLPLAGFIGVMLIVVYETGDWHSLKSKNKLNILVLLITIITSVWSHNLAFGVILGSITYYLLKNIK